jgi:hypothetical protein
VYGVHFTYEFANPVNFSSLQFFLNSGTVSIPVFTPRWVFFFGSNDGTNWAMFNDPQRYEYPFPSDSFNFVVVNNLQHTYTFTPYSQAYTYYRFVVASAGTGYFYLSSAQWNSSGQTSASDVATSSLTTVNVGTSNRILNLQTNQLRLNDSPFGVENLTGFGTNASSSVSVGLSTQILQLNGSSANLTSSNFAVATTQTISPTATHTASQTGMVQTAIIACTAETGNATNSTAPATSFRVPFQWRIIGARAHYTNDTDGTPPTSAILVDIRHNTTPMSINTQGTSIFGTARLNIDANRYSTVNSTAVANNGVLATNPVVVPDDSVVSIFLSSTTTGAQGVKVVIYYTL